MRASQVTPGAVPNNAAYQGRPDRPGLLITRPAAAADAFAQRVRARFGAALDIIVSPILTISYRPLALDLGRYPTLIFTSAHAVRALATVTQHRDVTCYAVGGATREAALAEGFDAKDGGGTAALLAQRILRDTPQTPCLYLRGAHVACDLAKTLSSAGIDTQETVIYDQQEAALNPAAQQLLSSDRSVMLPLFSARSAALFFDRYAATGPLDVVAMSAAIAAQVPGGRVRSLRVCAAPTAETMLLEIAISLQATNQLEGRPAPK